MLTLKEWMELVDYRITEGSEYTWDCYGPNAHTLDSWNGEQDGHSFSIIFDTRTQEVYEVQMHDYVHQRAYRMINPDYKADYDAEVDERGEYANQAWDDVNYVDLEEDDDFIQKGLAIKEGEDYDTRVSVPLDLPDNVMFELMKQAHEKDITLNELMEEVLRNAIEDAKRDPDAFKERFDEIRSAESLPAKMKAKKKKK